MRGIEQVSCCSFFRSSLSNSSLDAKAASAAFAEEVGAGRAQYTTTASSPSSSTVAPSEKKPQKRGGMSDYDSTPESLGYTDPDIERAARRLNVEGRRES
jgi:hypothetical protein